CARGEFSNSIDYW
nr:immunoglobulin heavy chain junction region [Macaca mulatta]MOV38916.1 immunoglobulin heavy chain junction region [Macaca mulatta]MOV39849.1 immunoglobulin heavy chain junction region [Macaca mulatta]MOV39907.1 immunoglobulin heavy chain junction region [Macaca mulatta]MOV40642.1 immunoglobulin heavy chain junction region [Macaca mulatta]